MSSDITQDSLFYVFHIEVNTSTRDIFNNEGTKGHVPLDIIGFHLPLRREMLQRRYSWRLEDASSLKRVLQAVKQFQLLLRFQHEHLLQQLGQREIVRNQNIFSDPFNTLLAVSF